MRKNIGVTLIALIITIIVMLVLAGVVINFIVKTNLIQTVEGAVQSWGQAQDKESRLRPIEINGKKYASAEDFARGIEMVEPEKPKDWDYRVENDGTITILGYLNEDNTIDTVVVPNYIGGVPVKRIKGSAEYGIEGCSIWNLGICDGKESLGHSGTYPKNLTIKKLVIADGIEAIEDGAFLLTKNLEEVVLPFTLVELGDGSFNCCSKISKITIPNNVVKIGKYAFAGCTNIKNLVIPNSVKIIDECAFAGTGLSKIAIPESVTYIYPCTFEGCSSLTDVIIPNSVLGIGRWAFYACEKLCNIVIPESVVTIEEGAFCYCNSIGEITIPSKVMNVGEGIFHRVSSVFVHVSWEEGKKPNGWSDKWNDGSDSKYKIMVDYAKQF